MLVAWCDKAITWTNVDLSSICSVAFPQEQFPRKYSWHQSWKRFLKIMSPRARGQWVKVRFFHAYNKNSAAILLVHASRANIKRIIFYNTSMQDYHQTSNIRCTKSQNLNVSCLVMQLSLCNLLKPGVKSRCCWNSANRQCSNYIWVQIAKYMSAQKTFLTFFFKWYGLVPHFHICAFSKLKHTWFLRHIHNTNTNISYIQERR